MIRLFMVVICLLSPASIAAAGQTSATASAGSAWLAVGGNSFEGWTGLTVHDGVATLQTGKEAAFEYPRGPSGWYSIGFRTMNDSTCDWTAYYGLQADVHVPDGRSIKLRVQVHTPKVESRAEYVQQFETSCKMGGGWHRLTLPWSTFDLKDRQTAALKFVQSLCLSATTDGQPVDVQFKSVRLTRAPVIALESPVRGKSVEAGQSASYDVIVTNCTDSSQDISLGFQAKGWDVTKPTVRPDHFTLGPAETGRCIVTVAVPAEGIPRGGHETQRLLAISVGDGTSIGSLEFITARDVDHPSILLTPEGWNNAREKVAHYDWAKKSQDEDYVKTAEAWKVPEAATSEQRLHAPEAHPYVFLNANFDSLSKSAIAWQLTRKKAYAEKAALFLRRLADEKTGYPSVFAGTSMGEPQEGENFQGVAIAYDAIKDAGVLTDADCASIEKMFRQYMEVTETALTVGNVGNWNTAGNTGCLFLALAMGDLAAADRYLYGPSGFTDYLSKGVMDDGWWWECSTSYNFWVASELTQSAIACRPWGIDLLNLKVPASYSPYTIITPWGLNPPYGMSFQKWGPNHKSTRTIKQLWDAVPVVADYRGIAFGMNDGHEERLGASRLDLAYFAFGDPAYARILRREAKRDLLYGVPELPTDDAPPTYPSAVAENLGFALLRSQTPNRPPREQIQAVFKIGTQGGYHGHFDRVSLDNLTRYGRSFWNPESIWYGYGNYMYKFFVQNSVNHNMVVVDQKQQEAVPSTQLLFFSGKMMQVSVQETNARWSDPPYFGMQYDSNTTVASLIRKNEQSLPVDPDRKCGDLGPFSDRVLQRRVGIVTDDYVVIADYLKAQQPHTFDNLFQMKGFNGLDSADKKALRHDAQFSDDIHSSAQFITDCDWYTVSAPAVAHFENRFGPGADNAGTRADLNENGNLELDVHSLWPPQQQVMVATSPETHNEQQWVRYQIDGGGKKLAEGESGVWILGDVDVDVPVDGIDQLSLTVSTDGGRVAVETPGGEKAPRRKSLFWANPRIVLADGSEVPLDQPSATENIDQPEQPGHDYYGGSIKIAGIVYDHTIAAQPSDTRKPGVVHLSLQGKKAMRFKATLGGDFPFGDESQRRKVYSIRSTGTEARFLTVIEPYENKPLIQSAVGAFPDALRVVLTDGRVQDISITNLTGSGTDISVQIHEQKDGREVRSESAPK